MRVIENQELLPEADRAEGCAHPRETYNLIGHAEAEARFLSAYKFDRLHHAWLLNGPKGIGKATLAYRMARFLLGGTSLLDNALDIPASDPVAQRVEALSHGNLFLLRRPYDVKLKRFRQDIPVDTVRQLSGFFQETAAETGQWRVCLVDSADELNRNSENAILKLLEEPPSKTLFILISSTPGRLLPTIRSRCMDMRLHPVAKDEIRGWLSNSEAVTADIDAATLDAAVTLSRGAPGKALALVQNAETVLHPLSRWLKSLDPQKPQSHKLDMSIAKTLAEKKNQIARELFWDGLQDTIQAQALQAATGQYDGPFQAANLPRGADVWSQHYHKIQDVRRTEQAINLDKTAAMFDLLSALRAA